MWEFLVNLFARGPASPTAPDDTPEKELSTFERLCVYVL